MTAPMRLPAAIILAAGLAGPAAADTIRFDFSGTTFAENQSLPRDQAYTATALFDIDVPPTTTPPSSDRIFADALISLAITIGSETLTANRPGRAVQSGTGGPDAGSQFGFDLGARSPFDPVVDAIDGTITGTDGRVYDPITLGATLQFSFALDEFLFDDVGDLLNAVTSGNPVTLPSSIGTFTQINFVSDGPPANLDFRIDGGTFSAVTTPDPVTPDPVVPVPVPAAAWLLVGALGALRLLRRS